MVVCARKTCDDLLREGDKGPSLKERHGSFIRCPTNSGTWSSFSRSYNLVSDVRLSEESHDPPVIVSISEVMGASGICEVGISLNTDIWAGRKLLNLPDLPVHAKMLVSPELVSSCANSRPSAWSPSPYTADNETEKIPNKE